MSSSAATSSLSTSNKLRRNHVHGDHQNRTPSSSSSHVAVGGLTHLPCRMRIMSTNKHVNNFLSSPTTTNSGTQYYSFSRSLQPNKRTAHIRAIENLPGAPLPIPSSPPNSGWFNWFLWTVIPMLFPLFKSKMSPLMLLKQKVDTVVCIVDHAAEVLEDVAEEVVKITDEFEDKIPEGTTLKKALCSVHDVAEEAIKVANLAEDLVDKGEALEKKMEDLLDKQEAAEAAEGQQQQKAENIEKKMVDLAGKQDSVITTAKEVEMDMKDLLKTAEATEAAKQKLNTATDKFNKK